MNPNEADLLVGTRSGQLGMISQRKHFISFKREAPMHTKRINCILMIKKEGEMLFMTASEDNTLKLWSYRFEEIFSQDVRKMELEDSFKKFQ